MPKAKNAIHNKTWVQSNPVIERVGINGVSILSSSCCFSQKYIFEQNTKEMKQDISIGRRDLDLHGQLSGDLGANGLKVLIKYVPTLRNK